jgi:putative proteasome-type protease
MKVEEGIVAMADTRVTSGTEYITARKITMHEHGRHSLFIMTSGLRAVRDKAVTYFDEVLEGGGKPYNKLYKAVNAFAEQIRRVASEDKAALRESGLVFNLNSIVGGQMEDDKEHKLYLLYPEANWIEVSQSNPYFLIGQSAYGKPLLDRFLNYKTPFLMAMRIGYLAFNATRVATTDVDYPVDMLVYKHDSYTMVQERYEREELESVARWWQDYLAESMKILPAEWCERLLKKVPK